MDPVSYFPRGLRQPEGRFRFSVDALLLAAFARPKDKARVLDVAAGCGVVGLGLLLRHPGLGRVLSVDIDPAMSEATVTNAARLGVSERVQALTADVRSVGPGQDAAQALQGASHGVLSEGFDLALCNPPYRDRGQGRVSPSQGRALALFEGEAGLGDFFRCAAFALKNKGVLCCIHLAERLAHVLAALAASRLEPKRIMAVYGKDGAPARFTLIEASKNGGAGLRLEPPLVLYQGQGPDSRLSEAALAFCPFLACNQRRKSREQGA